MEDGITGLLAEGATLDPRPPIAAGITAPDLFQEGGILDGMSVDLGPTAGLRQEDMAATLDLLPDTDTTTRLEVTEDGTEAERTGIEIRLSTPSGLPTRSHRLVTRDAAADQLRTLGNPLLSVSGVLHSWFSFGSRSGSEEDKDTKRRIVEEKKSEQTAGEKAASVSPRNNGNELFHPTASPSGRDY